MASIRDLVGGAVAVAALIGLTGCATPYDAAGNLAMKGLSEQLQKLETDTKRLVGTARSPEDASKAIETGDEVGRIVPDSGAGTSTPLGSIYDVGATPRSVTFRAILQSSGESGGGWTGDQRSLHVCVLVEARVPNPAKKLSIRGVPCRKDIELLLRKYYNDNQVVKLGDIPQAAPK